MATGFFAGLWDVLPCTNKEKYICKHLADGAVMTHAPPTVPPLDCAEGWSMAISGQYCIKVGSNAHKFHKLYTFSCFASNLNNKTQNFNSATALTLCIKVKRESTKPSVTDRFLALCLKVFPYTSSNKRTWYEARDYCRAIGGDLLSIHSTDEIRQKRRYLETCSLKRLCSHSFRKAYSKFTEVVKINIRSHVRSC